MKGSKKNQCHTLVLRLLFKVVGVAVTVVPRISRYSTLLGLGRLINILAFNKSLLLRSCRGSILGLIKIKVKSMCLFLLDACIRLACFNECFALLILSALFEIILLESHGLFGFVLEGAESIIKPEVSESMAFFKITRSFCFKAFVVKSRGSKTLVKTRWLLSVVDLVV